MSKKEAGIAGNTLGIYFREVKGTSLLSKEEQKELVLRIRRGDQKARNELVERNLRLVITYAKRYQGKHPGWELKDLIQEGNLALLKATESFDPEKGEFATYAGGWIRSYLLRSIDDKAATIRIPVHMKDSWRRFQKKKEFLLFQLGREPTVKEMAEIMGISVAAAKKLEALHLKLYCLDLDKPIAGTDDLLLRDSEQVSRAAFQPSLDQEIGTLEVREEIKRTVKNILSEDEYAVISMRFGLEDDVTHSLEEIGQKMRSLSRERIRQIQNKALKKLRGESAFEKLLESLSG